VRDPEAPSARVSADPEVISPHAVLESGAREETSVLIGGRVVLGSLEWRVADAFASLPVTLANGRTPEAGALVIVRGSFAQGRLSNAELIDEQPGGGGSAIPEFERLFERGVGSRLRLRARLLAETRRFFLNAGFLEVDTPLRSAESGTETHVEPLRSGPSYLITSPELHMKRLLVAGVPRLFQIVHCFRADELGPWHAPEFSMLEWYRAFADWTSMLSDTERLIAGLAESVHGSPEVQLADGRRIDLRPPFLRLSVREAFSRHAGVADAAALAADDEDTFFQLLVDRVEPALASYPRPIFLHDYPSSQAALARVCPNDPSVAERFELYLGGIELCNGYGELSDPREQRRRCELDRERRRALGRPVPERPERFLTALDHGMPKASGNALGMDRLIAILAGQSAIEEVCPFPPELV
jgi:lysyl-tRNA synthetase class 2